MLILALFLSLIIQINTKVNKKKIKEYINECRLCRKVSFYDAENEENIERCYNTNNPKVSVVSACYNQQLFVIPLIRSIQKQLLKSLEIIIVDDFSSDMTVELVKDLQKFDNRIKLIQNKKNMGTLYTKSIGALNARGKYIQSVDCDDLFGRDDFLEVLYEKAESKYLDLIKTSNFCCNYNRILVAHQKVPKIYRRTNGDGDLINMTRILNNRLKNNGWTISSLFVKTYLYKKALKKVGAENYSRNVVYLDDVLIAHYLHKYANDYNTVNYPGVLFLKHKNSASHYKKSQLKSYISNAFFVVETILRRGNNTESDNISALSVFVFVMREFGSNLRILAREDFVSLGRKLLKNKNLKALNFDGVETYKKTFEKICRCKI